MILLNMAGLARPARMAENSSRVVSTDLSILPSASLRMSLITGGSLPWWSQLVGGDEGANLLTLHDAQDVAPFLHAEHDQRQLVLHAQREGGRIRDPEMALESLLEGQSVVLGRRGVQLGVGAVDAVDALLGHQHDLALGLEGTLGGHGVGGEERHAGTGAEDDHPSLLEMADGAARDVGL